VKKKIRHLEQKIRTLLFKQWRKNKRKEKGKL